MRRAELVKILAHNGFRIKRRRKHAVYWDGIARIVIPSGQRIDWRLSRAIRLEIKKAVGIRGSRFSNPSRFDRGERL